MTNSSTSTYLRHKSRGKSFIKKHKGVLVSTGGGGEGYSSYLLLVKKSGLVHFIA